MIKYRSDIDGLRALAVLPILIYHAGFSFFPGGFVGVDIFFVISGYLITSILLKEIEKGRFSIMRFYERRARRILPALLLVITATLIAGYFCLLSDEYLKLAKSSLAALFFVPNIYFWTSTGYFAIDAQSTPLLHTWSLGVEEQFYFIFPVLIFFGLRVLKKSLFIILLIILALSSFFYSLHAVNLDAVYTFYMLPTRAWELLLGALLAFNVIKPIKSTLLADLIAAAGLLLIIGSILLLNEKSLFPGVNALYPALGSALIIYVAGNSKTLIHKVLSLRPLVAVGLISYSLYLWHWPVTVYANMLINSIYLPYGIIILSFVLSAFSYFLLEQPVRKRKILIKVPVFSAALAFATLVVVTLSGYIYYTKGMSFRISEEVAKHALLRKLVHSERKCHFKKIKQIKAGDYCTFGNKDALPTFAIIGDSHADALRPGLEAAAIGQGKSGIQLTSAGCRPLAGVFQPGRMRCKRFIDVAFDVIDKNPTIDTIFLAGYWRVSYVGESYRYNNVIFLDEASDQSSMAANSQVFVRGLNRTIERFPDKKIVFVGDTPEIPINPRKEYARSLLLKNGNFARSIELKDTFNQELQSLITQEFPEQLKVMNVEALLCPNRTCQLFTDDQLIYRDRDHLANAGALSLAREFESYL